MSAENYAGHWSQLRTIVLRRRTEQLVGAPTNDEEQPDLRFTVIHESPPASGITVTLDDACDLADVYDLCTQIAAACLDDDDRYISFTRATPHPDTVH